MVCKRYKGFERYFGSVRLGAAASASASADSGGRKTRYKAGPMSGTNDKNRSQEPLSNLQKEKKGFEYCTTLVFPKEFRTRTWEK